MTAKTFFQFIHSHQKSPELYFRLAAIACFSLISYPLYSQTPPLPDSKFWITDGPVNAILATNNTVYIGGDFSYVGPRTGPLALFNQATGGLLAVPPQINGIVKTVVSDGTGGWFIGGTFAGIGGVAVTNLAHLNADLTPDGNWNANLNGTTVNALALDSGRLYIGGNFSRLNGQVLSGGLAGVDVTNPVVSWNPLLSGSVNALQITNGLVYAGGSFFSVGSSNVQNLAAISTSTALATAFSGSSIDQAVLTLFVSGANIYVGGQFTTIGTKSRNRLAALDLSTGIATTWNPKPNVIVRALFITSTNAYIGGDFTTISVANRRGFASIGLTGAGTAQSLDIALQSSGTASTGPLHCAPRQLTVCRWPVHECARWIALFGCRREHRFQFNHSCAARH